MALLPVSIHNLQFNLATWCNRMIKISVSFALTMTFEPAVISDKPVGARFARSYLYTTSMFSCFHA